MTKKKERAHNGHALLFPLFLLFISGIGTESPQSSR